MPRVLLQPGTAHERGIELKLGANTFGRAATNDCVINDPSVSGLHCEILVSADAARLIDLGSTNGTFVDGRRVQDALLEPGTTIRLGNVELHFEPAGATASAFAMTTFDETYAAPPGFAGSMARGQGDVTPVAPALAATTGIGKAPPTPPLAPYVAGGPVLCKFHPRSPGRFWCARCHKGFCDLCVNTRRDGEVIRKYCRACGTECAPVQADFSSAVKPPQTFFQSLPGAFAYPFRKDGLMILIGATLFFGILAAAPFIRLRFLFLVTVVLYGYLFAYMQNIIHSTAAGDEAAPDLPDVTEIHQDIVVPCFQLLAISAACFGPTIILLFVAAEHSWAGLAVMPVAILGAIYFPMAFLAVAMYDTVAALNPMLIVPSILRVPGQYLVACALLAAVVVVRALGEVLVEFIPILFVPTILAKFLELYFLTVEMRVLGLLYFTNRHKLGWLK